MSDTKTAQQQYIDEAAKTAAREVLHLQHKRAVTNHYRAMEHLLRAYKKSKLWEEHPEEYGFFPTEKSHDISVAPPPGLGIRDKVEANELFVQSKELSFVRSMARFGEVDAVVKSFENREDFIIIRMYYFNEDETGADRGQDAKPYTFPEITEALQRIGIDMSERACRYRRTKLVREMTVLQFGIDGAISIESREITKAMKHNDRRDAHDSEEAEEQPPLFSQGEEPRLVAETSGKD